MVRFKFVTNFFPCNISTDQKSCFYEEILTMVDLYGYTVIESEEDCVCPEAIKENQRIYLHFGELSGYCRPSELECIERMLSCGTTFKIERKLFLKSCLIIRSNKNWKYTGKDTRDVSMT